jgi:hypothetical protein
MAFNMKRKTKLLILFVAIITVAGSFDVYQVGQLGILLVGSYKNHVAIEQANKK